MMQHNGDWACGPLIKACSICSIMTRVSVATFPEKSQAAHSSTFNKTFNATDSLFSWAGCEAACCFFWSLLALWVNGYYGRTNKEKVDDNRRENWSELITKGAVEDEIKIFDMITLKYQK